MKITAKNMHSEAAESGEAYLDHFVLIKENAEFGYAIMGYVKAYRTTDGYDYLITPVDADPIDDEDNEFSGRFFESAMCEAALAEALGIGTAEAPVELKVIFE
jgi:hypothetical protein